MSGNIIGIIAQRLIRKLCVHCKEPYSPSELERKIMGLEQAAPIEIFTAQGCEHCEGRGFKGRTAITEVLKINPDLDEAIAKKATTRELTQIAKNSGFMTLADDGIRQILNGITSLDEVSRVVDFTSRIN